jgi:hypothetical protein
MCGAAIERPHLLTDKSDQGEPPIAAPLFVFQLNQPEPRKQMPDDDSDDTDERDEEREGTSLPPDTDAWRHANDVARPSF